MTTIVKIDRITKEVLEGSPQSGDFVRVTTDSGTVIEQEYTEPSAPVAPVKSWDAFDFKARFTPQERIAIRTAAKSDASVEDFLDMLDTAGMTGTPIKANDALLNAALDALTAAELIGAGRKDEILGA